MDDGSTLESNKPNWDDKYTKSEVDNKLSAIEINIDWKESVDTFTDISTAYPDPQDGWTVNVRDTDYTYRYSGEEWVVISANAIPKATRSIDGLLTKEDKTSYDSAVEKKHEHDNKSALDMITSEKIAGWDELSQNSATGVKGNKEETYRTGNINITKEDIRLGNVDNTSDKDKPVSTAMQEALDTHTNNNTIHLTASDRQQFFRGNADWGWRNPEWTEDVDGWVLPGCYGVLATCTHHPPHINEPWGNIMVFPSMDGRILQIYYDWNDPDKVYHRVINGTTASNWIIFASGSELDTHINNGNIHFTSSERQQLGSPASQFGSKANAIAPLGCNTLPTLNRQYINYINNTAVNDNKSGYAGYQVLKTGYYWVYARARMDSISPATQNSNERVKRLKLSLYKKNSSTETVATIDEGRVCTYETLKCQSVIYIEKDSILVPLIQMDSNGTTNAVIGQWQFYMEIVPQFVQM